jgi:hypothetical protein
VPFTTASAIESAGSCSPIFEGRGPIEYRSAVQRNILPDRPRPLEARAQPFKPQGQALHPLEVRQLGGGPFLGRAILNIAFYLKPIHFFSQLWWIQAAYDPRSEPTVSPLFSTRTRRVRTIRLVRCTFLRTTGSKSGWIAQIRTISFHDRFRGLNRSKCGINRRIRLSLN